MDILIAIVVVLVLWAIFKDLVALLIFAAVAALVVYIIRRTKKPTV